MAFFAIATILSFMSYKKLSGKSNVWLTVSMVLVFSFTVALSNVLEWAKITSALDPAEDFLNILVALVCVYVFYNFTKS